MPRFIRQNYILLWHIFSLFKTFKILSLELLSVFVSDEIQFYVVSSNGATHAYFYILKFCVYAFEISIWFSSFQITAVFYCAFLFSLCGIFVSMFWFIVKWWIHKFSFSCIFGDISSELVPSFNEEETISRPFSYSQPTLTCFKHSYFFRISVIGLLIIFSYLTFISSILFSMYSL